MLTACTCGFTAIASQWLMTYLQPAARVKQSSYHDISISDRGNLYCLMDSDNPAEV